MRDFFRFVLRGALGGMIFPLLLSIWFFVMFLGWRGLLALIYFPDQFFSAIPGAMVGFVLWSFTAHIWTSITPLRRMALGIATIFVITFVQASEDLVILFDYVVNPPSIVWGLTVTAVSGCLAGLACPRRRLIPKISRDSIGKAS